jgi:hypothetical protein
MNGWMDLTWQQWLLFGVLLGVALLLALYWPDRSRNVTREETPMDRAYRRREVRIKALNDELRAAHRLIRHLRQEVKQLREARNHPYGY